MSSRWKMSRIQPGKGFQLHMKCGETAEGTLQHPTNCVPTAYMRTASLSHIEVGASRVFATGRADQGEQTGKSGVMSWSFYDAA